jgi:hypothetical protein
MDAKTARSFIDNMRQYFGGNVDEAIGMYERDFAEDKVDEGNRDNKDEDGDIEQELGDFDSGIQEESADVVYHGMGNEGFDTIYERARTALEAKREEVGGKIIGAWDKLKRDLADFPDALHAQENELIKKYGEHGSVKSKGSRYTKLKAINERVRYVAEQKENKNWSPDFDKRDIKDAEDRTKQGKKTDPEHQTIKKGRLVLERMVDDTDKPTGVNADGEMTFAKKAEEFVVKTSKLVTRIRKSRSSGAVQDTSDIDLANTWNQLMTALGSMLSTDEFSGRIGYRTEPGGPVTWIEPSFPSDKEVDAMAEGKKVKVKVRVAETGQVVTVDEDAATTIKELRDDIQALEALKLCMGA